MSHCVDRAGEDGENGKEKAVTKLSPHVTIRIQSMYRG